jgi:hypothetical protein
MKYLVAFVICLVSIQQLNAQSLSLLNIDTSNFPSMKAKFLAFDANWNQKQPTISQLSLLENDIDRIITGVNCPITKPPSAVSITMSFDVSTSMDKTLEFAKETATELCNVIVIPTSEFAVHTSDEKPLLVQDFTTDRNKILSIIPTIEVTGGNNFIEHLLNSFTGLLQVAKYGKNKKVAVIFTDAWWFALSDQQLQACKDICEHYNIQFIAVIYSSPGVEPNGIKKSLQELATSTGGYLYDGITSKQAAKNVASKIQTAAQGDVDYCEITWESGANCGSVIARTNVELTWNRTRSLSNYMPPASSFVSLDVTPNFIAFGKIPPSSPKDTTITLKAINSDLTITGIKLKYGSPIYTVVNTTFPLSIPQNTSKQITLHCAPNDSALSYAAFEIITTVCSADLSASSGFIGKKNKNPTLRLVKPNGGEKFVVGSDTLISWEGIAPSDTVTLKYSKDNGINWTKITDSASGLNYRWTTISKPTSDQCLVSVIQGVSDIIPKIEWQKIFGGSKNDYATSIQQTNDNGYIVAGYSESKDGNVISNKGGRDYWILKLSVLGAMEWQKTYGGSGNDEATSIQQTNDGGYIVVGYSSSSDGDVIGNKGSSDYWVVKLSKIGAIEWQKTFGGNGDDIALSVRQTNDGGYIVVGWSDSKIGDMSPNKGNADYWIVKLSSKGVMEWEKICGGSSNDYAASIQQTKDGGYIIAGYTYSADGNISVNKGFYDSWIVKLSGQGAIEWQKTYGGSDNDYAASIQQTQDGGYIVAGWSDSKGGDVIGNKGSDDYWILKLNPTGTIEWQKTYGGSSTDRAKSIQQTYDGGYIIAGYTYSIDKDISGNNGGNDFWILKLSAKGIIQWQKILGGSNGDYAVSVCQTNEAGYIIAGWSDSKDGISTGNKGGTDALILKLSPEGEILQEDQSDAVFSIVAPEAQSRDIDLKQCLVGSSKDSLIVDFVSNIGTYKLRTDSIYFRGQDATAFRLSSGIPPYIVEPTISNPAEITFIPHKVGKHTAEVVIITQSDTLVQKIIGEGIAPILQVLNNLIDFGIADVGAKKDTLNAVTIKNIGSSLLTITSTHHAGPNVVDYTTIAGGGSFTLNPGDSAFMDIRFAPSGVGRTSGRLLFDYDAIGSPATVQLFGEGVKRGAQILAAGISIPPFACEKEKVDTMQLRNIGIDTLFVYSATIGGIHPTDFQFITPFSPVTILPDSTLLLPVKFVPTSLGNRTATIELRSNSIIDSILTLSLSGIKESADFSATIPSIDIGILCPNEIKDTTIILTNIGTVRNTLHIQSPTLTVSTSKVNLGIAEKQSLSIRYIGPAIEGTIDEILTITDSICGVRQDIRLVGTIKRTKIISQTVADFGSVAGGSATLDVFAVNKDIRPIIIESPKGITLPFTLDALFPPAGSLLAPNDTVKARIRFDAISNAQIIGYLNWSVILPCPSMDSTELRAQGVRPDTARSIVSVQNITAQAGEKVNIILKLQQQSGLQLAGAPTDWYARIHYNKTILFNEQSNNLCAGTDDSCVLELSGKYDPKSNILISIPCVATLGNTDNATITIDKFRWTNSAIITETQTQNGTIHLTGICDEGGVRLFIPANTSTSLTTRPNPIQNTLQIQYGLREPLTVTLELMNMTGQVVQTLVKNQQQVAGQYILMNDMSLLGNGVYQLRLVTEVETLTTRVDVVK